MCRLNLWRMELFKYMKICPSPLGTSSHLWAHLGVSRLLLALLVSRSDSISICVVVDDGKKASCPSKKIYCTTSLANARPISHKESSDDKTLHESKHLRQRLACLQQCFMTEKLGTGHIWWRKTHSAGDRALGTHTWQRVDLPEDHRTNSERQARQTLQDVATSNFRDAAGHTAKPCLCGGPCGSAGIGEKPLAGAPLSLLAPITYGNSCYEASILPFH